MRVKPLVCHEAELKRTCGRRVIMAVTALCAGLLLSACGGHPGVRIGDDGIYRFASHPIEVRAPDRCLLDMAVSDSQQTVEFVTGRGFWEAGGRYALHVFPVPGEVVDTASFEARAERFFQKFLVGEPGQFGVRTAAVSQRVLTVEGSPALRAIAVDPGRAVFVATARLHTTRISVASLLFPLAGTESPDAQVPWPCYERFVESVSEVSR